VARPARRASRLGRVRGGARPVLARADATASSPTDVSRSSTPIALVPSTKRRIGSSRRLRRGSSTRARSGAIRTCSRRSSCFGSG
jgi:hypothetical protein